MNPPSFNWLHETDAHRCAVPWSRHADFSDATTITNLTLN